MTWTLALKDVGINPRTGLTNKDIEKWASLSTEDRIALHDEFDYWLGKTMFVCLGGTNCLCSGKWSVHAKMRMRYWRGNAKENLLRFFPIQRYAGL